MMITEEEKQIRKLRIIHVSFNLFCKNGINGVTITNIAQKSHVSETSVYRYFNTKAGLLSYVQTVLWLEIVEKLTITILKSEDYDNKNGLEQIEMILSGFRLLFEEYEEYVLFAYDYRLFLIKQGLKIPECEYDGILISVYKLFVNSIYKGKNDGSVKAVESEEDIYYSIWGLMRGFIGKIVIYDRMYNGKNPWDGRFDIVCSMILSALKNGF